MAQPMQQSMWCKATLQYPTVNQLPLESVGDMLNKASNLATTANFQWSFIDKPADGSIFLVYLQNGTPVPPDGFMYMDSEQPYSMNVAGKPIEIWEHKFGFIPGQEQITSRSRRRFRLSGKNPNDVAASLWLLFYSRTGDETRVAANPMQARPQPMRKYPLPNITTKPFNLFQAVTGAAQMPNHQQQLQQQYQMQQIQAQQSQAAALQAQQQSQQGTPRQISSRPPYATQQSQSFTSQHATPTQVIPQKRTHASQTPITPAAHLPPEAVARMQRGEVLTEFEEPVGDELDALTPIDISKSRFIRHQEWMEEIFSAYSVSRIERPTSIPENLSEDTLKAQIERYKVEMEEMKRTHEEAMNRIRHPEGLQGRIKSALEKFENDEVPMTAEGLTAIQEQVALDPASLPVSNEVAA